MTSKHIMKKTLIALLALAGMVSTTYGAYDAEDAVALLYRDASGTWNSALTSSTVQQAVNQTTGAVTLNILDAVDSSAVVLNKTEGERIGVTLSFTLDPSMMDLSALNGETPMIYLFGTGASGFGAGIDANGKIYNERITTATGTINQSFSNHANLNIDNSNLPSGDLQTWFLTLKPVATKNQVTGLLDVNGNSYHYTNGWTDWSLASVMGDLSNIALSSAAANAICSIGVWTDIADSADNKASLLTTTHNIAVVPEPATATLSLLALAGLVARRRRH